MGTSSARTTTCILDVAVLSGLTHPGLPIRPRSRMSRYDISDVRRRLKKELIEDKCIVTCEHVDYGGGYHGNSFLSVRRLLHCPGRAWRLADDLCNCIPPALRGEIDVVVGCDNVGSMFALLIAGLLDSNRPLLGSRCHFEMGEPDLHHAAFHASADAAAPPRHRVLLVSEWSEAEGSRNQDAHSVQHPSGTVVARVALWGWPSLSEENGVPLAVLCDWIVSSGVRDSECLYCRSSRQRTLNHRTRASA
jgi:hypothetical protein